MNNSVRKNYVYSLSYQIFSFLAPLVTTPYVARVLLADGVGLYSYTYSIATVFVVVAQLGTVAYGQRAVAYCQGDVHTRSQIFWNVFILRLLTSGISTALFLLLFFRDKNADIFIIQSMCVVAVAFDVSWFFFGVERFREIAIRDILSKTVSILCVFAFVKDASQVGLYSFILASAIIAGRLSNWLQLRRYVNRVSINQLHPLKDFRVIMIFFIPQCAAQLYAVVDKMMIGMYSENTYENGFYAQADRIVMISVAVLSAIVSVMMPRVAEAFARGDDAAVRRYTSKTYCSIWIISLPMMCGMFLLIDHVIPWFLGVGYDSVSLLVKILCIQIVMMGLSNTSGSMYLVATGRQTAYSVSVAIGIILNIMLNALLIPRFLGCGAAVATIIAQVPILVIQLCIARKSLPIGCILRMSLYYIPASAIMSAVLLFTRRYIPRTFTGTILLVALGAMVYGSVLFIQHDSFFMSNISRLLGKFRKL